jgi:glutamate-1-semialdehyde aminotransferase
MRELTVSIPWDAERLEEALAQHRGDAACFILSVPYDRTEEEIRDFLRAARALTTREGVLLVYDEIVTGFRLAMGGAQERFGVVPDLAAFSKAMANGFPIGAVTGRKDVMAAWEGVTISSTFGGEAFSMAASLATLAELREKRVHEHLWKVGTRLMNGINAMATDLGLGIRAEGLAPVFSVRFEGRDAEAGRRLSVAFQRELLTRGVMPYLVWYITYSHAEEEIERTLRVIREAMEGIKSETADVNREA